MNEFILIIFIIFTTIYSYLLGCKTGKKEVLDDIRDLIIKYDNPTDFGESVTIYWFDKTH